METKIQYWTQGSKGEDEGLTISTVQVDLDGNIICSYGGDPSKQYKARQVSKKEYDKLKKELSLPDVYKGLAGGLVTKQTHKRIEEKAKRQFAVLKERHDAKVNRVAKRVGKMVDLGVLDPNDEDFKEQCNDLFDDVGIKIDSLTLLEKIKFFNKRVKDFFDDIEIPNASVSDVESPVSAKTK